MSSINLENLWEIIQEIQKSTAVMNILLSGLDRL